MCRLLSSPLLAANPPLHVPNQVVSIAGFVAVASATLFFSLNTSYAADPGATPEQAAAAIDLSRFELIHPVEPDGILNRRIAGQSYIAKGTVAAIAGELKKRLSESGWKALEGSMVTDQYANETYQKSGFTLSLSVSSSGNPEEVRVNLMNHGNIDFQQLALPNELATQLQSPVMSMLGSPWTVEETAEKISESLLGTGWSPYGTPGGSQQFKQNGVRLNVSVMAAAAQDNRTIVQISSEQMSADIPVPAGAESVQYSDSTRSVSFDHSASLTEVFANVRDLLRKNDWSATSESPVPISFRQHLIFRNPGKDMIEVICHEVDGKTRARIDFKDAADVEALNKTVEAEAARRKAEMAKQSIKPMIVVSKPVGSKITETQESQIEFSLPAGKALAAIDAWAKDLEKQGWKRTTNARNKTAGNFTLKKGEVELHVTYVDPGILAASMYLSVFGKATLRVK